MNRRTRQRKKTFDKKQQWEACKEFFGYRCAYCGRPENLSNNIKNRCVLTKDHIFPQKYGGTDIIFNLIPCCQSCNSSKGCRNAKEWFRKQSFYSYYAEKRIIYYINTLKYQMQCNYLHL